MHIVHRPYRCRVLSGTGTASRYFPELLDRWADWAGYRNMVPGSLNLGANRDVVFPDNFESLDMWKHLCLRQDEEINPRLYEVSLNYHTPAWVFCWNIPGNHGQVGHADGCPPQRRLEVVADVRLKTVLALEVGSVVDLLFV